MTIEKAMRTLRLPNPTTPEDLESRWSKILTFGDRRLQATTTTERESPATSERFTSTWTTTFPAKGSSG